MVGFAILASICCGSSTKGREWVSNASRGATQTSLSCAPMVQTLRGLRKGCVHMAAAREETAATYCVSILLYRSADTS